VPIAGCAPLRGEGVWPPVTPIAVEQSFAGPLGDVSLVRESVSLVVTKIAPKARDAVGKESVRPKMGAAARTPTSTANSPKSVAKKEVVNTVQVRVGLRKNIAAVRKRVESTVVAR